MVGLLHGGAAAWVGSLICCAIATAQLISIFVGRGQTRARAIGYVVPLLLYLVLTGLISDNEYSGSDGVLPHTRAIQRMANDELIAAVLDAGNTGQRGPFAFVDQSRANGGDSQTYLADAATPRLVMVHLLLGCVLGSIGSLYALTIYNRSIQTPQEDN